MGRGGGGGIVEGGTYKTSTHLASVLEQRGAARVKFHFLP